MKRKITQAELGEFIGLSASAISDLGRGKREPTITELKAYHKAFKVPLEYLLGLSNSRY
jgi:transcriptional regulator with XRE-family HTH domain